MEHEMTTQREKIVDHVWQMIITMGIKAVRMDDVANVMGTSPWVSRPYVWTTWPM